MLLCTTPSSSAMLIATPVLTKFVCQFTTSQFALNRGDRRRKYSQLGGTDVRNAYQRGARVCCNEGAIQEGRMMSPSNAAMAKPAPVLLLDVMGTIIRDPFFEDIPAYFGMTMKELLAEKHPTAWVEFETGQLTEDELYKKFFSDGRDFNIKEFVRMIDIQGTCHGMRGVVGLKECMVSGYNYLEGMEELLLRLQSAGYTMHAFSNYPCWYTMIEDKLELSRYMPWTFVSCHMGLRKPDSKMYLEAAQKLKLDPPSCIFVDDRRKNVEAALEVGMMGVVFENAKQLERDLAALGCNL